MIIKSNKKCLMKLMLMNDNKLGRSKNQSELEAIFDSRE